MEESEDFASMFRDMDRLKELNVLPERNDFNFQYFRYGITREQLHDIFDGVNKWLPTRYEWVMSSLTSLPYEDSMPKNGTLFQSIRTSQREMSTPARYDIDISREVGVENEIDAERLRDAMMLEARCMVHLSAECSVDCCVDSIENNSQIPLYGCRDHGLIHICIGDRVTCSAGHVNSDKEVVCVYSGARTDGTVKSSRMYNTRKNHAYVGTVEGDDGDEEEEGEDYYDDVFVEENYISTSDPLFRRIGKRRKRKKNKYAKISNGEMNWAMVRSAVVSGKGCVIAPLAEEILAKQYFPWVPEEGSVRLAIDTMGSENSDDKSISIADIQEDEKDEGLLRDNILFHSGEVDGVLMDECNPYLKASERGDHKYVSRTMLHAAPNQSALFCKDQDVVALSSVSNRSRICEEGHGDETWNIQRAQETRYSVNPYKETLSRKMAWDSLARGVTPTFLVEGTNDDTMDIASRLRESPGGPQKNRSPYSTPSGVMTSGEGLMMSPGRLLSHSYSSSTPSSPLGRVTRRKRNRGSPQTTLRIGYSLNSDGHRFSPVKRKVTKKKKRNKKGRKDEEVVEQYYLIQEEDANSTRTSKKRKRVHRRKNALSLSTAVLTSQFEKSVSKNPSESAIASSAPMIIGKMADIMMGRPSIQTMQNVIKSSGRTKEEEKEEKEEEEEKEEIITSSGLIGNSYRRRRTDKTTKNREEEEEEEEEKEEEDYESLEFKRRRQRFESWLESKSLLSMKEMNACMKSVGSVMNDLIFNSQKRQSMKIAYGIASLINTEEVVKKSLTAVEKDLRPIRERDRETHRQLRRKYKKTYRMVRVPPVEYIWDYCVRNRQYYGEGPMKFLSEHQGYDPKDRYGLTDFLDNEKDIETYKYGSFDVTFPEIRMGSNILTLGEMDDIYAEKLQVDAIDTVPHNQAKIRLYRNEITRLWRVLLASKTVRMENAPKSQFDHFILGVLYHLAENDITINGKVVMKKDEWLKSSLPSQKRLCDNHTGKLKRRDVAEVIQKNTDLDEQMLKFSTPSRVYASRIVTRGIRRVKEWTSDFQGHNDIDTIVEYIHRNSVVDFIKVSKTMGNTHRGRGRFQRKRTSLFL